MAGADLSGADLTGANLTAVDLTGIDLRGLNLIRKDLSGVDLTGIDLSGSDLTGADLSGANLTGADLSGANLTGADLSGTNLTSKDLSGIDLRGTDLRAVILNGAKLSGANLTGIDLTGANLVGTDLAGIDLVDANLTGADLSEANLLGGDLRRAYLVETNLTGANLSGTNLRGAILTNANLTQSNLTEADFDSEFPLTTYLDRENLDSEKLSAGIDLGKVKSQEFNWAEKREFVILCIGESTTAFGGRNSWPNQLQRILNSIQDKRTFRVINRGLPGVDTNIIYRNLSGYLTAYQPDFVLAMVGINDSFEYVEPIFERIPSSQTAWLNVANYFRTSGLIEWIDRSIQSRITGETEDVVTANAIKENGDEEKSAVYNLVDRNVIRLYPQTMRNLNDMVNLTTEQGINFVFVSYALRKTDILKDVIEGNALYIDSHELFLKLLTLYDYDDLFWDSFAGDFGHATSFGQRVIADNVARQFLMHFTMQE